MSKSERRIRKETVNNLYIPPPARNRIITGSENPPPPPPRKKNIEKDGHNLPPPIRNINLENSDCSVSPSVKNKNIEGIEYYVPPPARNISSDDHYGRNRNSEDVSYLSTLVRYLPQEDSESCLPQPTKNINAEGSGYIALQAKSKNEGIEYYIPPPARNINPENFECSFATSSTNLYSEDYYNSTLPPVINSNPETSDSYFPSLNLPMEDSYCFSSPPDINIDSEGSEYVTQQIKNKNEGVEYYVPPPARNFNSENLDCSVTQSDRNTYSEDYYDCRNSNSEASDSTLPLLAQNLTLEDSDCYFSLINKNSNSEDSACHIQTTTKKKNSDGSAYYVPPPARIRNLECSDCYVLPASKNKNCESSECYTPPPARNRNSESSEYVVQPQARKSNTSCCYAPNESKSKDRTCETRLKKTIDGTKSSKRNSISKSECVDDSQSSMRKSDPDKKICNNSSLLFKNECVGTSPDNVDAHSKKKRKKKKKKNEQKTEYDAIKFASKYFNETQLNSSDENCCEVVSSNHSSDMLNDFPQEENKSFCSSKLNEGWCGSDERLASVKKAIEVSNQIDEHVLPDGTEEKVDRVKQNSSTDCMKDLTIRIASSHLEKRTVTPPENPVKLRIPRQKDNVPNEVIDNDPVWDDFLEIEYPDDLKAKKKGEAKSNKKFWLTNTDKDIVDNTKSKKTYLFDSERDRTADCFIIEIYGFPEEFKTQDLLVSFSSFLSRGFTLKWVDNTHALGIFTAAPIGEEALKTRLPFVKTRPLSEASPLAKEVAQLVVPPIPLRPKTCPALARRLVSGALGVRAVFTKEEREAEKEMLKEAREQKKLAARQREAAWEGKF